MSEEDRTYRYLGAVPDAVLDGRETYGLETRYVGHKIYYFRSVESTSTTLKALAEGGAAPGTVVLAEEQIAGRGRSDRKWFSPEGLGIWASVLLAPDMAPARLAPLSIAAAVSVAEALLDSTRVPLLVKWPNDIVADGRKLGGILVESVQTAGDKVESAVLGMGLNVNLGREDIPDWLVGTATSLRMVLGHRVARVRVLATVLTALERCFDTFEKEGIGAFLDRWRLLSSTLGRRVELESWDAKLEGTVRGMSETGALLIEDDDGATKEVWYGDVKLRSPKHRGASS